MVVDSDVKYLPSTRRYFYNPTDIIKHSGVLYIPRERLTSTFVPLWSDLIKTDYTGTYFKKWF